MYPDLKTNTESEIFLDNKYPINHEQSKTADDPSIISNFDDTTQISNRNVIIIYWKF